MSRASDRVSDLVEAGRLIRRDTLVLLLMRRLAVDGRLTATYRQIGRELSQLNPGTDAMKEESVGMSIVRLIHHGVVVRHGKAGTTYSALGC